MEQLTIRPFAPADEAAVIALWARCDLIRPWNDPQKDIRRKLAAQPNLFLVGVRGGAVVAVVMAGYDGHRGWLNYLAAAPEQRGQGLGRAMVHAAEERLRALGCAKINLQVRRSNAGVIAFYERLGYSTDDVLSMGKRLEHDDVP
ncbi:hypothetical protein SE17_36720 [Kouleothrix aurantiaca]|uniref:N-acetyltransferase domain-containing protein n=1 Tax=Kouleothrix aurantiaca TaxID=186479 RepID=A0A0P9H3Y4_9CHLR|nr:hypothetical protein SE17_36720 [Kouleothrix aurantiaca]